MFVRVVSLGCATPVWTARENGLNKPFVGCIRPFLTPLNLPESLEKPNRNTYNAGRVFSAGIVFVMEMSGMDRG